MNTDDFVPGSIDIPDNRPPKAVIPPQLGDTRTYGALTPEDVEKGKADAVDAADIAGQAEKGEPDFPPEQEEIIDPVFLAKAAELNAAGERMQAETADPSVTANAQAGPVAPLAPTTEVAATESLGGPVDTTHSMGGVSVDGKWYAADNDGNERGFDNESDRDAYVQSTAGWHTLTKE